MPRIADFIVDCSIFLYKSREAAEVGEQFGGSGFLVHVKSKASDGIYLYAVTNKHVLDGGYRVLRLTKKSGGIDTITTERDNWIPHPRGYDVEILPLEFREEDFKWWSIGTDLFITREIIDAYRIGLGDEAFLVGRLVNHAGQQRNTPIVRFGNISLMADPNEPIKCEGQDQEGFLVECRSLSGFSGSPVLVSTEQAYHGVDAQKLLDSERKRLGYVIPIPGPHPEPGPRFVPVSRQGRFGPWLLGIDWGHIKVWADVKEKGSGGTVFNSNYKVDLTSGIACVLPAWHIMDLLNVEELVNERRKDDEQIIAQRRAQEASANDIATESKPSQKTAQGTEIPVPTSEQFFGDLEKASRKKE